MANYFPLIVNSGNATIYELPAGDNLDLASSNIVNAVSVTATSNINGGNIVSVAAISGASLSVSGGVTAGNIVPLANSTYNLGSNTLAWNSLYVAGNTIYLGTLQLKDIGSNTFAIYTSDGTTQANIDVGAIDVSSITQGNSAIGIAAPNGNAYITVGGNANVLLVTSTGISTPGTFTSTGNATVGNLSTSGIIDTGNLAATGTIFASGNVTGDNFFINGNASATGNITSVGNVITGNLVTAGLITATGNITAGNLITSGLLSVTGTITTLGNISTNADITANGTISVAGTATLGNVSTGGTLSATGNANVGNLGTTGVFATTLSASGNANVGNLGTTGVFATTLSASGNTNVGNLAATGTISASGNLYSNTALYVGSGATDTGLTNPIIVAKSTGLYYIQMAAQNSANTGSADLVAYADNGNDTEAWMDMGFTGSGFNDTSYTITGSNDGYIFAQGGNTGGPNGGNLVIATGALGTTHDIVFATGGFLSANERMRFIDATGQFYIQPTTTANSTSTGALRVVGGAGIGGNIYAGGLISATGEIIATSNVSGNNLNTSGVVSSAGTVTGGNLATAGTMTATGNAEVGNLSTGGTITATGNVVGGNIVTSALVQSATISATGTVTVGNVATGGTITATGNIQSNGTVKSNTISSVSGELTVSTNSGDLILNSSGNIDVSNNYINNLLEPVQASDAATKEYVDNAVSTGITIHDPVLLESPIALNATYAQGGNTYSVNQTIAGNTVVFSTAANLQPNDQLWFSNSFEGIVGNTAYFVVSAPNTSAAILSLNYSGSPVTTITSNTGLTESVRVNSGVGATLTNAGANATLQVDGVTVANTNRILLYQQANAAHNGVYVVSEAGNATTAWQLTRSTDADLYGPKSIEELDAGDYFFVQSGDTGAGESYVLTNPTSPFIFGYNNLVFTQFSSSQVYSANTAAGLSLSGTVFSAKVDNDTTAFSSGNIVVKAGANLTTPNIGAATGTSLSLTGTATVGNVSTGGTISASGNITGNYFFGNGSQLTGIDATSIQNGTSNVRVVSSGGDVTTSVGGTSNVVVVATTGMTVTGVASVTGTATVGNISTGGTISASGNITGGNVLGGANVNATLFTGTTVSVTGNIDGGNVLSSALIQGVTLSASGNVNGANLTTAGSVSATGTITGGNLVTGGTLSVGGTTTAATINATTISASGNITGGNLLTGGLISSTGNITGGNVLGTRVSGTNGDFTNVSGNGSALTALTATNIASGTLAQARLANASLTVNGVSIALGGSGTVTATATGTLTIGTGLGGTSYNGSTGVTITNTGVLSLANGGGITASVSTGAVTLGSTATNNNTAGAIVARDGSGNFSAGTITASLSGTATNATNVTGTSGTLGFSTSGITIGSGGQAGPQVQSQGGGAAVISLHRPGAYAINMGLDTDNVFKIGGWSDGANVYRMQVTSGGVITGTATSARYADLAEKYRSDAAYEPGTVLDFGGDAEVTFSTQDSSRRIAGVVSTNPAHLMNSMLESEFTVDVALAGRVPVKVQGLVHKGDMLVSAGNGRARAEADPKLGSVIGKALENFADGEGTIEVLILML